MGDENVPFTCIKRTVKDSQFHYSQVAMEMMSVDHRTIQLNHKIVRICLYDMCKETLGSHAGLVMAFVNSNSER